MTDYTPAIPNSALVREIAELTEHSVTDTKAMLEALEVVIASHLRAGHDVRLVRLGTLGVKTVPARKGKSFGVETTFPARLKVGFRASQALKNTLENAK
jgi:nucleoid DNA-binding protein